MVVGFVDSHAEWVDFDDLESLHQFQVTYYAPR